MKTPELEIDVQRLRNAINEANGAIALLHSRGMEIGIAYKDTLKGEPPRLEVWKIMEHVDYLK